MKTTYKAIVTAVAVGLIAFVSLIHAQDATQDKKFGIVILKPSGEALTVLLKAEAQKAKESGLKPFVEFYADWCGPCKALRASLKDPKMVEAFTGTYIIQLDVDVWKSKLSGTAFSVRGIPLFFEINDDGKPTGRSIGGDAWGANTPSNMAPPLGKFFKR